MPKTAPSLTRGMRFPNTTSRDLYEIMLKIRAKGQPNRFMTNHKQFLKEQELMI